MEPAFGFGGIGWAHPRLHAVVGRVGCGGPSHQRGFWGRFGGGAMFDRHVLLTSSGAEADGGIAEAIEDRVH